MPEVYKRLGAIAPTDNKEYLVYSAPTGTNSLVSNVTVTNRSSSSATFDINVYRPPFTEYTPTGSTVRIEVGQDGLTEIRDTYDFAVGGNGLGFYYSGSVPQSHIDAILGVQAGDTITTFDGTNTYTFTATGAGQYSGMGSDYVIPGGTGEAGYMQTAGNYADLAGQTATTYGVTQQSDLDDTLMSNGFVALPNNGTQSAISTDGVSWITGGSIPDDSWNSIISSPNIFVAVGGNKAGARSTKSIVSTNGISWTQGTLPSNQGWVVAYGNETFVASGAYYSYSTFQFELRASAASTNGITWTQGTLPSLGPWWSVAFGNNVFVSTAGPTFYTSNQSAVSTNGITWTVGTMPSSAAWTVGYGDGKFVAAAVLYHPNAVSAYSTNGISWTQGTFISSPSSSRVNNIVYGSGTFVASMYVYGGINQSIYSTDGLSWNVSTLPESKSWGAVGFNSGVFVIMPTNQYSSHNTNIYSTNGITWTVGTMPSSAAWSAVTGSDYISIYSSPSFTNLYKTSEISANETQILEPGIALSASASIVAKDNSGGNLTFSTYGVELS